MVISFYFVVFITEAVVEIDVFLRNSVGAFRVKFGICAWKHMVWYAKWHITFFL